MLNDGQMDSKYFAVHKNVLLIEHVIISGTG